MSLKSSDRTKMLVKLAVENKLAVISEELTVISVTDTLREAGLEVDEQIHSPSVHSHHYEDDFDFNDTNNQDFATAITKQDENILPDYIKNCVSPMTSPNIQNENQPPEGTSTYIAPMPSQIVHSYHYEDDVDFNATNNQNFATAITKQDENILPDYTKDCVSPMTSQNIQNENQPPEGTSTYIAPMPSQIVHSYHYEDDFDFNPTNNQDFTTAITKQGENALPDYTKDCISLTSSPNLQNENQPPEFTSTYIAPMSSQTDEYISHNNPQEVNIPNIGQNLQDITCCDNSNNDISPMTNNVQGENVLLGVISDYIAPLASKSKNNLPSDDLQNYRENIFKINNLDSYSDFSDSESSESEYFPSTASVVSDMAEDYQDIVTDLSNGEGTSLENYQIGETKKNYSRKTKMLQTFTETEKSVPSPTYAASQPSTSKDVPKQNKENGFGKHKNKPNLKIGTQPNLYPEIDHKYLRKPSARERPTICPFCFDDVITHFPRHLLRHHTDREEVKKIRELGPKNKERIALIKSLRKQGYFHLKVEKNINNPVRNSKNPNTNYAICQYCLGDYSKSLLHVHVKQYKSKPADVLKPGKNCLSNSQTFMASVTIKNDTLLRSLRIREEVFRNMIADDISFTAKSDVLICLYGETLLAKHKREQISTLISSKIREMARMLIALRSINQSISHLFDALKPELFSCFVLAAKNISGYDLQKKNFRAPSLALHMGTNLKIICNVAYKIILERKKLPTITWENFDTKRQEIKDLKKLIEGHWCNEISSLALKTLKERKWEKPIELPLASDILLFQNHIYEQAENAYEQLTHDMNQPKLYKILVECILAHTIMFNRKRVGDVQYLTIETYTKDIRNTQQEAFTQSLTEVEKILSQQFKRVVTGGKGSKPVAILFSKKMQKYINYLLQIREMNTIVPKSNPYLFANPGSEKKWIIGVKVISKLAKNCGAERPTLLTSTKFRKHIATTLQLMTMQPEEMEQLAIFMGHTKKTHAEFYRLPQDIYQVAKVAKVLLLLEKGKGKSFQGKSINEIELEKDIYYSSNSSEDEERDEDNTVVKRICKRDAKKDIYYSSNSSEDEERDEDNTVVKRLCKRETSLLKREEVCSKNQKATELHINEEKGQEDNENKTDSVDSSKDSLIYSTESNTEYNTALNSHARRPNKIKEEELLEGTNPKVNKNLGRIRWTQKEKDVVNRYFTKHIQHKITPKKDECNQFLVKYGTELQNKNWVRVKTLVYNTFRGN